MGDVLNRRIASALLLSFVVDCLIDFAQRPAHGGQGDILVDEIARQGGAMLDRHLPRLGVGFWVALCFASVFGANMGDFFAHNLALGHVKGLPILAVAFLLIVMLERFDRLVHDTWYWAAIVVIRTAATNLGDLLCGDWRLPRLAVMAALMGLARCERRLLVGGLACEIAAHSF